MATRDSKRLARNLRFVIGISFPIGIASLWPFYADYWRFRNQFVAGNFIDATGQARYEESAVWGLLSLASLSIGVCAWLLLSRESRQRGQRGDTLVRQETVRRAGS